MDSLAQDPDQTSSAAAAEPETTTDTAPVPKGPYPPPAGQPTQEGPRGIRFDFNLGARVVLPDRAQGKWRVRLRDLDTGNILFQSENQGAFVSSAKRYLRPLRPRSLGPRRCRHGNAGADP